MNISDLLITSTCMCIMMHNLVTKQKVFGGILMHAEIRRLNIALP